ncbi:hypothetical protein SALBM311S_09293 [Streptomyces alboniger]
MALVFVTMASVAAVAHAIVPGLPIAAAFALGALVAPPDPVAATAVAGQLGLPRRLVSILEGEGLFNDVTAIVLYHVAIAAAVGGTFSPWRAGLDLVLSAVVAVAVGLALGWATNKVMSVLGDATLQIGMTLLVPYVAYVLAEELHGSGVLAVLTTAMFLAEYAFDADDVMTRLAGHTVWDVVDARHRRRLRAGRPGTAQRHPHGLRTLGRAARLVRGRRGRGDPGAAAVAAAGHLADPAAAPAAGPGRGHPHLLAGDGRHVVVGHAGRRLGRARRWRSRWRRRTGPPSRTARRSSSSPSA